MNVEAIGDREFIRSIKESDGAWALFSRQAAYMLEAEGGRALPIWNSANAAEVFAIRLGKRELTPVYIPLDNLLGASWLESPELNIVEFLASPVFGQPALTYTAVEFGEKFKT